MKRENRALVQLLRECVIIIQQDGFDPMLVDAFQALNEYIEISKFYSTPKSNGFINGVLDKAIDRLTKDKKIVKIGRGLVN